MTTSIIGALVLAALFATFGVLKPRAGCGGSCDSCTHGCDLNKDGSDD